MLTKVAKFIDSHALLDKAGRYLVALSGGADSVALLRVLIALGYSVEAAHCNFHLRGEESCRDEDFCQQLAQRLGVKLHVEHFDTKAYARQHAVSIEMAARELRYDFFRRLSQQLSFDGICIAHHSDDSVETVLLNLARGTGLEGLKGILPRNGSLLRPLLCVTRKEITDYLAAIGQDFVTDSTNLADDANRNKVRLNILPELERINPAARQNIARMTTLVQETLALLQTAVENEKHRVCPTLSSPAPLSPVATRPDEESVSIPSLLASPAPQTVLWSILREKNFSPAIATQLFRSLPGSTGRQFFSPTHEALIDRERIIICPKDSAAANPMRIESPGKYYYNENTVFSFEIHDIDEHFSLSKSPDRVCLDADKVEFPLTIRTPEPSDRFHPFGMNGTKLVSDFLTDRKLSLFDKRRQLLVADSRNRILWLVSLRPDNRLRITPTTRRALIITKETPL